MELDNRDALIAHIKGLQITITERNARIAELQEKLAIPMPLEPEIEKRITKAYKDGWKDCATHMMELTRNTATELGKVRKEAYRYYLEAEKEDFTV